MDRVNGLFELDELEHLWREEKQKEVENGRGGSFVGLAVVSRLCVDFLSTYVHCVYERDLAYPFSERKTKIAILVQLAYDYSYCR